MTTITFDKELKFSKKHFRDIEEFQMFIWQQNVESDVSQEMKVEIDNRLNYLKDNPEDLIARENAMKKLRRK